MSLASSSVLQFIFYHLGIWGFFRAWITIDNLPYHFSRSLIDALIYNICFRKLNSMLCSDLNGKEILKRGDIYIYIHTHIYIYHICIYIYTHIYIYHIYINLIWDFKKRGDIYIIYI